MTTGPIEHRTTRRTTIAADHRPPARRQGRPMAGWLRLGRQMRMWLMPVLLLPMLLSASFSNALAQGTPTLSIHDVSRNEGNSGTTTFAFSVTLSSPSSTTVTVHYSTAALSGFVEGVGAPATSGSSCTAGVDFIAVSDRTITFRAGDTQQDAVVQVCGDTTPESNEIFFVDLSGPFGATIQNGQAIGTIINDDVAVSISIATARGNEGNSGTTDLAFPVTLSVASPNTVTVQYSTAALSGFVEGVGAPATSGSSCTAGVDFIAVSNRTLTFQPNVTRQDAVVQVCGDTTVEGDEVFFVDLSAPVNATIQVGQATGTIVNDDGGTLSMSINDVTVVEPASGTRTATFTVTLSATTSQSVTVNFATRAGTAQAGGGCAAFVGPDYLSRSGTLTIPAGRTSGAIAVTICGDQLLEPNETFFVDLTNASGSVSITRATGTGTIQDAGFSSKSGVVSLSPDDARVDVGDPLVYIFAWTVPEDRVWRDLNTLDLRIRPDSEALEPGIWVRWDEASDTFSLCSTPDPAAAYDPASGLCGAGAVAGSPDVLAGQGAVLNLADSTSEGSGPTGPTATLTLSLNLNEAGRYLVEVAGNDDLGNQDGFFQVGNLQVGDVASEE